MTEWLSGSSPTDWMTAVALLGAGAWFLYRWGTGYLTVDASISVRCERRPLDDARDELLVHVDFERGEQGSIDLVDAGMRIVADGKTNDHAEGAPTVSLQPLRRASFTTTGAKGGETLALTRVSATKPFLRLAPKEKLSFAGMVIVPSATSCVVDVGVLGRRAGLLWFRDVHPQWRAATYSMGRAPAGKHE